MTTPHDHVCAVGCQCRWDVPRVDAPPRPAFKLCVCHVLVLERVWHNRTEDTPAHWERQEPCLTAALGYPHVCGGG